MARGNPLQVTGALSSLTLCPVSLAALATLNASSASLTQGQHWVPPGKDLLVVSWAVIRPLSSFSFHQPSATLPALSAAQCLKPLFPLVFFLKSCLRKEGKSGTCYCIKARSHATFARIYESFQRHKVHKQAYTSSPLYTHGRFCCTVLHLTLVAYYHTDCSV